MTVPKLMLTKYERQNNIIKHMHRQFMGQQSPAPVWPKTC